MIYIMIIFCVLTYSILLLAMICGCVALFGGLDMLDKNVRAFPEEVSAVCKAYKYLN